MKPDELFCADFKTTPFWWEAARPREEAAGDMPSECDVLVIGSGYTGLNAALHTAKEGLSTLVIDAQAAGAGCSTRNGGQVSAGLKPEFPELARRHGNEIATALFEESQASVDYLANLVDEERLDCDLRKVGGFHGAHHPRLYQVLEAECRDQHKVLKTDAFMVPRNAMAAELGTDAYHGGIVYPHDCSIDAGKYHSALLSRVLTAGALLQPHCPAISIERTGKTLTVTTAKGNVRTGKVIIATNGYSGRLSPYHRSRIIPIGSYIIATEPLDRALVDRLFPTDRVYSDTRRLIYYYRLSPDRQRMLFGGRVSLRETNPEVSATQLHRAMTALFPDLSAARISHSWYGFVGYTFDKLAHCGEDDGIYYAMGYCGSGVAMSSYLGMRMGRKAAGTETTLSAFERIPFPGRPFYNGNPWFLAPSVLVYRFRDHFGI